MVAAGWGAISRVPVALSLTPAVLTCRSSAFLSERNLGVWTPYWVDHFSADRRNPLGRTVDRLWIISIDEVTRLAYPCKRKTGPAYSIEYTDPAPLTSTRRARPSRSMAPTPLTDDRFESGRSLMMGRCSSCTASAAEAPRRCNAWGFDPSLLLR